MQAILVMFRSDGERRSFSIMRDMTVIGRREDCDLRIPLSDVSRKHCRLVRDGETLRLEDLGSSNGTYRNGERVQEAILSPGDTLQVGPVQFVLQIDGNPADDQLAPAFAAEVQTNENYDAAEQAPADEQMDEPVALEHTETETVSVREDSGAHDLSEHATIEEPTPVVAPAPSAARTKSNGAHAAPPPPPPPAPPAAAESDKATPFHSLEAEEEQSGDQEFFIIDEPNSSSQSGEIQVDLDSPSA